MLKKRPVPLLLVCGVVGVLTTAGCSTDKNTTRRTDPKLEAAHDRALEYIERVNVLRKATDRSYYYPREVADLDGDGRYEVIVGWHPEGGPGGADLLWQIHGDTMVMCRDSARLARPQARMKFDSGKLIVVSPYWNPTDSLCCPGKELRESFRVIGEDLTLLSFDTLPRSADNKTF